MASGSSHQQQDEFGQVNHQKLEGSDGSTILVLPNWFYPDPYWFYPAPYWFSPADPYWFYPSPTGYTLVIPW